MSAHDEVFRLPVVRVSDIFLGYMLQCFSGRGSGSVLAVIFLSLYLFLLEFNVGHLHCAKQSVKVMAI